MSEPLCGCRVRRRAQGGGFVSADVCHDGETWRCAGCLRLQCHLCDGIAGPEVLCWSCFNEDGAA
jgi:hypothetical protein